MLIYLNDKNKLQQLYNIFRGVVSGGYLVTRNEIKIISAFYYSAITLANSIASLFPNNFAIMEENRTFLIVSALILS